MAAEEETPQLWEPEQAVAFLLGTPRPTPASEDDGVRPWDGALGGGITRALFGTYRVVLSSQDLPVCGFAPSCSRFSAAGHRPLRALRGRCCRSIGCCAITRWPSLFIPVPPMVT